MLGAGSVNSTAGIGNALFVFNGDSWKGKPSMPIRPRAVFFFWLQYFLSEPNTLDEYSALSLKNTSALILYFSSTLSLSAFGNCFVNCSHAFFFAKAFVSGFRYHLSKSLGFSVILDRVIFVQNKMVVLTIVTQKNGETIYFDQPFPKCIL